MNVPVPPADSQGLFDGDWRHRLAAVLATVREMSSQSDPQAMVQKYAERMNRFYPTDRRLSLSRRGLQYPRVRVTRFSQWTAPVNPWHQPNDLPVLDGGLLGELIYGDEPRIIHDLVLSADDPAAPYLEGQRSVRALPLFDGGTALNMVVATRAEPHAFREEQLPEMVWMANLFGRATHNLVLAEQLQEAYRHVENELRTVADIQRSLLPARLPEIATLRLAAHYQTSRQAGGDYYDFFALPDGCWGVLIADVSGHGTPAAVIMAITHSIAHTLPGAPTPPPRLLEFLNEQLATRYTAESGTFVTAFYGIYDPHRRTLTYSSAGHNPPRLRRASDGTVVPLDRAGQLPLGVTPESRYAEFIQPLEPGDRLLFYTDGITEAPSPEGELFGLRRTDNLLASATGPPDALIAALLERIERFTGGAAPADDRTLLVADVLA